MEATDSAEITAHAHDPWRLKGTLRCVCKPMAGRISIEENIVQLCRLARQ